jgi:hypothetical protein
MILPSQKQYINFVVMLYTTQIETEYLQKVKDWSQLRSLLKTVFLNADRQLVQANRTNTDWLIEYVTVQLCVRGYYTDKRRNTIIKLCNRHITFFYDLKPALDAICKQRNISMVKAAHYLGYKRVAGLHNAASCSKLRDFLAGIAMISDTQAA